MKHYLNAVVAATFLFAAGAAFAQQGSGMKGMDMSKGTPGMDMNGMDMKGMAMHMMPATVTAVDLNTGIMDVSSEGMTLKLHFPPSQLMNIKSGDKLTLHLGFSKP